MSNTTFDENNQVYRPHFTENDDVPQTHFNDDSTEVGSAVAVKGDKTIFFNPLFKEGNNTFDTTFGEIFKVREDAPHYTGAYDVTPKVHAQTLPTAEKYLSKDVTIKKIPYFEVSNNSGGETVYIGNEV